MVALELLILFAGAFLGGMAAWVVRLRPSIMKMMLAFSGAFMLGLSFFHILPESYELVGYGAGVWVLAGFMLQVILEMLSKGMEHGHAHDLGKEIPFALFIGLGIHAMVEGMPFGGGGHAHDHDHHSLLVGVMIHKVPVAFILGTVLRGAGFSLIKGVLWLTGFALMAPIGGLLAATLGESMNESLRFQGIVFAVLVGIFLHIATTIIFEADKGHRFNLTKLVIIMTGFVLAFLFS